MTAIPIPIPSVEPQRAKDTVIDPIRHAHVESWRTRRPHPFDFDEFDSESTRLWHTTATPCGADPTLASEVTDETDPFDLVTDPARSNRSGLGSDWAIAAFADPIFCLG